MVRMAPGAVKSPFFFMAPGPQISSLSHRRTAVQLASLSAIGPFCIDAYLPSIPEIALHMGVSIEAVQTTLTAYMIPFALMTLWHGALSDALGRRRVILWGMAIFSLAAAGCALAPSLPWLIFFRILQGATAGVGMVVGRAIVRDLYHGPEAQKLMSMVAIVFAIAPAVSPVIGGWLQHWFGWRAVFVFSTLYSLGILAYLASSLPETLAPEKRQKLHPGFLARSYWAAAKHPAFITASLAITVGFSGFFLYVLSAPVFLMKHLHVSETGFLWLFGPVTIGLVGGNYLSGRLAGHVSLLRTALYGGAIMLISAVANVAMNLLMAPTLPWAVIPVCTYMLGMSLAAPSLTIRAIDCFPQQRGLAASCQSFLQSGGNSLVSALVPLFWGTSLSLSVTQLLFGTVSVLLILGLLRLAPGEPHSGNSK